MKMSKTIKRIFAITIAVLMLFAVLTSCKKQNTDDVISHIGSSEITSSEAATSEPEKEKEPESSKPEESSKPQESSKPKPEVSSKPQTSSTPKVELPIEIPTPIPTPTPESTPTPEPDPEPTPEQKTDAELLIGKWATTVDMAKGVRDAGFTIDGAADITTTYEFTASNTVIIKIDEEQFRVSGRPVIEQMLTQMVAQQYNMTLEEFAAQNDMTSEELVTITVEATIDSASDISEYTLNKNGIYIKDSSTGQYALYTYEFKSEDELILTYEGEPATFTRV